MNEQFIKNIRVLKKAIAERKLVVFAGSGISIDSGVPSWEDLIKSLRSEISIPDNESDFLRIAQMYFNERQHKELIDKLRDVLKHKKLRYNEIHEEIFELNPEHVITTNFDDLLEQVIKAKAHPFSTIIKDSKFPYARNTKLLVKMHGDLEEANVIIKEDDYTEYSQNHPLIESFIKGVFANKIVLFIGYSFSDINLKIILQNVRNILRNDFQNAYMLSTEDNFHSAKRQYLKNKGINVINFHDAGLLFDMNAIEQYLFVGRNALNHEFAKRNNTLSPQGARLLYMIKFITKYIDFAESVVNDDPLTQMYKSLERFNEVRVLPPTFLGNLFPFNSSKRYISNFYKNTLGSNNNQVTGFFFNEIDYPTNKLKDDFLLKNNILDGKKELLDGYLTNVIEKLNFATIFYFGRSNKKFELFDDHIDFPEKVNLLLPDRSCDCLNCLFNNFKIKEFLKRLKEETITETSEIQSDLLLAYSNYKAGNFKTAYQEFEQIANKAWQLEKYISYFIAKRNIKDLRNMIKHWDHEETNEEKKKVIVENIDDLDIDKLISQIPNLGDDEYKLLKTIRDDEVLTEIEVVINEYYDKIVNVFDHYKAGNFSSGPYYPYLIQNNLHRLFSFYNYNFIIKDEYSNFRRVFEKGIKAFLICYSVDDRYPEKLREFNFWILKCMIQYADDGEMIKTIEKYNIADLKVKDKDLSKLIIYLNNLFKSVFNETNFLGRSIELDDNLSTQTKSFFFESRIRNMLHNAFILFACIKIDSKYSSVLIRNFLDFLKAQNILKRYSSKYLNSFLNNLKDQFSYNNFIELLQISNETKSYYVTADFYKIIAFGIKSKFPESKLDDEDLINTIITQSIIPKKHRHERGFMYLWKVASEKNKTLIKEALESDLAASFDVYDYLNMNYQGIISPPEFSSNYIEQLERHIPKDIVWLNDKPENPNLIFFNFVNMIYGKNLLNEEITYSKFDEYPEFWKFYFKPYNYDYPNFDPKWLLVVNVEHIHRKLNQIKEIGLALNKYLKKEFNEELSKIYVQFYL